MPIQKIVRNSFDAYAMIQSRLLNDLEPVWQMVNSRHYSPFWLIARELFPVAESIGSLLYDEPDPTNNLAKLFENDLSKISPEYRGKGLLIAHLFRHSLMHQDEPRSICSGKITINWSIGILDGRYHLIKLDKNTRSKTCTIQLDLRTFYEDIIVLLELYKNNGPRSNIATRYNNWTFKAYADPKIEKIVEDFYNTQN